MKQHGNYKEISIGRATLWQQARDMQGSKGEIGRIEVIASILIGRKDPLFPLCVPKRKKKEEKEKFALWLYNCPAMLSAVYILSFQVYRAALFLHGSSGTGALMQALRIEVSAVTSGKQSAKKVKESRSLLRFFFFLSLLPSFLRYGRNKSRIFAI